ncbi:hypothetical protein Rhow_008946 [Rhodococcus wratislaviensis]|uniref:Uncharacterized protein n=1 Tax=Rhodococcus wratislaviensis TaxID=44752 RepID=A0A402CLV6_RHOWR|nr:hypothetical protein Rhow_008946 [Rhodococcus wratislaviensis]
MSGARSAIASPAFRAMVSIGEGHMRCTGRDGYPSADLR